jgi:hypothetical protein
MGIPPDKFVTGFLQEPAVKKPAINAHRISATIVFPHCGRQSATQ